MRCGSNFILRAYFKFILQINIFSTSHEIGLKGVRQHPTDDKSTLVQVMMCGIRQQAIMCANVDPDIYHHMASLGHNELN